MDGIPMDFNYLRFAGCYLQEPHENAFRLRWRHATAWSTLVEFSAIVFWQKLGAWRVRWSKAIGDEYLFLKTTIDIKQAKIEIQRVSAPSQWSISLQHNGWKRHSHTARLRRRVRTVPHIFAAERKGHPQLFQSVAVWNRWAGLMMPSAWFREDLNWVLYHTASEEFSHIHSPEKLCHAESEGLESHCLPAFLSSCWCTVKGGRQSLRCLVDGCLTTLLPAVRDLHLGVNEVRKSKFLQTRSDTHTASQSIMSSPLPACIITEKAELVISIGIQRLAKDCLSHP